MNNLDIKKRLKNLSEYMILKGGKKNLSKLIKVKRPFKTKTGKVGYRDTWVLPGQVKSDEKIHNEHKLHHLLPKDHPDYKKKELHPNFVAGRDKHLEARKKPNAEAPKKPQVAQSQKGSQPPKVKLTQKKKDQVIKRLKETQHLYEGLYGDDGHVPHSHKEGAGLADVASLGNLSQDQVAKIVKEAGGSVKNKNGMNHYRMPSGGKETTATSNAQNKEKKFKFIKKFSPREVQDGFHEYYKMPNKSKKSQALFDNVRKQHFKDGGTIEEWQQFLTGKIVPEASHPIIPYMADAMNHLVNERQRKKGKKEKPEFDSAFKEKFENTINNMFQQGR